LEFYPFGDHDKVRFNFFLESLSKSAYDFLLSERIQDNFIEGPFSEPSPINGNINGGLGVFGAINHSEPFLVEYDL